MAEWSNAAVLKTVDLNGSGGSNPSLSAEKGVTDICSAFFNFSTPKVPQKSLVLSLFGGVWSFNNYFHKSETGIDSDYTERTPNHGNRRIIIIKGIRLLKLNAFWLKEFSVPKSFKEVCDIVEVFVSVPSRYLVS